jgi:hypothetical protein
MHVNSSTRPGNAGAVAGADNHALDAQSMSGCIGVFLVRSPDAGEAAAAAAQQQRFAGIFPEHP